MIGVVVLGVVHSAAQCNVNAKRLPKWPIYCNKTLIQHCVTGPRYGEPLQKCSVSSDITPSLAACTGRGYPLPHATPDNGSDYIF